MNAMGAMKPAIYRAVERNKARILYPRMLFVLCSHFVVVVENSKMR
jgi:hypothetical protein